VTDSRPSSVDLDEVIRPPHVARIAYFLEITEQGHELDDLNSLLYRIMTISEEYHLPTRILAVAVLTTVLSKELDEFIGRAPGIEDNILRRIIRGGSL